MSVSTVAFVNVLVKRFPALVGLFQEHINDNFGKILPHVFFGDFARYVISLCFTAHTSGKLTELQQLQDILDFLEKSYESGDAEVQELIAVSFLEHLPRPGENGSEIREMVGPHLARQLQVIG